MDALINLKCGTVSLHYKLIAVCINKAVKFVNNLKNSVQDIMKNKNKKKAIHNKKNLNKISKILLKKIILILQKMKSLKIKRKKQKLRKLIILQKIKNLKMKRKKHKLIIL